MKNGKSMRADSKIPNYPHRKGEFASYSPKTPSPTGKAKATANKKAKRRMAY